MVSELPLVVGRLERWLEGTRRPLDGVAPASGYGGPVVHWWRDSLLYCGPGFDWRYEGILFGYLALYRRTAERYWLDKAARAGDDLLAAQLPGGNFRNSAFELNPATAGTPHEAAVDLGLLALARVLRTQARDSNWSTYLAAARRNLHCFYLAGLWDSERQLFRDHPTQPSFVANKSATLAEALFVLGDLTGEERWQAAYARPTLDAILCHQVRRPTDPLAGGIAQSSAGRAVVEKYFPYYIARCIPALLEGARRFADERYLDAAMAAGEFLVRWRDPDGAFPQVVYPGGRVNRYPRWIAATGDLLRVLTLLQSHGLSVDLEPTRHWLLDGQLPNGAFTSAEGFGSQVSQRTPSGMADVRDVLPVVGWNDKAFRYLADQVDRVADCRLDANIEAIQCTYQGAPAEFSQCGQAAELHQNGRAVLRWRSSATWAEVS